MNASLNNVFYIQRSARSLSTFFCDDSSRLLAADIEKENASCGDQKKGKTKKEREKTRKKESYMIMLLNPKYTSILSRHRG
jgi:hypothetical protein